MSSIFFSGWKFKNGLSKLWNVSITWIEFSWWNLDLGTTYVSLSTFFELFRRRKKNQDLTETLQNSLKIAFFTAMKNGYSEAKISIQNSNHIYKIHTRNALCARAKHRHRCWKEKKKRFHQIKAVQPHRSRHWAFAIWRVFLASDVDL